MTGAVDIAQHLLEREPDMPLEKLHTLVYLCQAYSLAWTGTPLFNEEILATAGGVFIKSIEEEFGDVLRRH